MAKKHKRKNRYTVLFVSDSADSTPKELHALPVLFGAILGIFILIVVVGICAISYQQHTIDKKNKMVDKLNAKIVSQNETVDIVKNQNQELSDTIVSLNAIVRDLKSEKEVVEHDFRELSEQVYELCAPTGCPVTGTATVSEGNSKPDKSGLVIFETYANADIIASGNGTVIGLNNLTSDEHGYKYEIIIDHGNNFISYYYSDEAPLVIIGAEVDKAQRLFHITKETTTFGYKIQEGEKFINPWDMIEIFG